MAARPPVQITGLRELRRALRAVDVELPRQLSRDLKEVAELVAARARSKVPHRTGRTAASIRPVVVRGGAAVRAGGARVPWYAWLDFGGERRHMGPHHEHKVPHLQPSREHLRRGRYLYPALDEVTAELEDRTRVVLDRVFEAAGW